MNHLGFKIYENCKKWPSQFPEAQADVQRYSNYYDIWQTEAENHQKLGAVAR